MARRSIRLVVQQHRFASSTLGTVFPAQQRSTSFAQSGMREHKQNEQRNQTSLSITSNKSFSTSSDNNNNNNNNNKFTTDDVDYKSPLGDLISRLKMVSITGCVLSVCVMPALVFLKNGELPNAQQATMGTIATIGATGSTAALHFVFGAYVLDMKSVKSNATNSEDKILLEATTRSVFGFKKNHYVFDPTSDITKYVGNRPFANFCANGIPLYVHPERLDAETKQWLVPHLLNAMPKEEADSEGLPLNKKKKKDDDDDELF